MIKQLIREDTMFGDDETPKKKLVFEIGQVLDELSVEELEETMALLESEIRRLKTARDGKSAHLSAAEALFSSRK